MSMDSMLRTTAVLTGWVFSAAAVTLSMGGAIGAYSIANLFLASLALSFAVSLAAIATPFIPRPSGFIIHARPARPLSQKSSNTNDYDLGNHMDRHAANHSKGHFYSWKPSVRALSDENKAQANKRMLPYKSYSHSKPML